METSPLSPLIEVRDFTVSFPVNREGLPQSILYKLTCGCSVELSLLDHFDCDPGEMVPIICDCFRVWEFRPMKATPEELVQQRNPDLPYHVMTVEGTVAWTPAPDLLDAAMNTVLP